MKQGFTLIELLVVIAIIGILSLGVVASLNSAREDAREAGIRSSLSNIHRQAAVYYSVNSTYEGFCNDSHVQTMVTALDEKSDGAACWISTDTYSDYRAELATIDFGVAATLNETYYAVDPTGVFTFDDADTGGTQNWSSAVSACQSAGKRLSGPSALRALYDIDSAKPAGFTASSYWSSVESPSAPTNAYRTNLNNGSVYRNDKSNGLYVRCVH
ncbi:MAG: prepilin-type N-terminal cleavage/methylation domain-containing protein [Patescibacteria group bacterium]